MFLGLPVSFGGCDPISEPGSTVTPFPSGGPWPVGPRPCRQSQSLVERSTIPPEPDDGRFGGGIDSQFSWNPLKKRIQLASPSGLSRGDQRRDPLSLKATVPSSKASTLSPSAQSSSPFLPTKCDL